MSGWSDPAVLVAIMLGIFANVWNLWKYCADKKRKNSDMLWEEYRSTIDERLRSELKNSKDIALDLYLKQRRDVSEVQEVRGRLSIALNAIDLTCVKADKHPKSVEKDWSKVSECHNERIKDLIEKQPIKFEEIQESFHSYEMKIEERLLRQMKNMKKIRG